MMMDERAIRWSQGVNRMFEQRLSSRRASSRTKSVPAFIILLALLPWPVVSSGQESGGLRIWTDNQGRQVEAAFGGVENGTVVLLMKDGDRVPFPLERLSDADRDFAQKQPASPAADSARLPPEKRVWPDKVEVSARTMEKLDLVLDEPQNRKYVYRTTSFEFTSQDKLAGSVMREIARTFEATRLLVSRLPWGIVCNPPAPLERYQAALYETREDYFNNGGPPNSGGVYDSGDKIFKIPFPSLGLKRTGKTWFKDDNYRNDTLVHEITHQMMHDYLRFLPKWVIEGSAEYTQMLPYHAGTFRVSSHKTGIKEHIAGARRDGAPVDLGSVRAHLTMTREQWDALSSDSRAMHQLYLRSVIFVYFFNHLDGDGKGARFIDFFEGVHGEVSALQAFFANPEVKRLPGGRFTYPSRLQPPDMNPETAPFKYLDRLLGGRDYAKLAAEIIEGYRANGIKVTATE